jgi:hypothetical protein
MRRVSGAKNILKMDIETTSNFILVYSRFHRTISLENSISNASRQQENEDLTREEGKIE